MGLHNQPWLQHRSWWLCVWSDRQLKKLWLLLLLLSKLLLRKLLLNKLLLNKLLQQLLLQQLLLLRLKGSRPRGVLLKLKRQGSNKLLLLMLQLLQLLPKRTLLTRKSAQTLVPLLTQFTILNTKWRTIQRKLTSQGTRRETATSSPAPTPSLMPLEHWSLSTTPPA